MTKTEKLVFIADYIEPGRKTPEVEEIRDMAYNQGSLDKTIWICTLYYFKGKFTGCVFKLL